MKAHVHFRHQRLSAYALVILFPLLFLPLPYAVVWQGLVWIIALYHSLLGLTIIVEDYIRCGQYFVVSVLQAITLLLVLRVIWYVSTHVF